MILTICWRSPTRSNDAVDRYKLLADQMETHNNPELVKIFRDLARAEGIHGEEIR